MRLYDTITQSDLNNVIDKLLNNYHREIGLDLDDPVNDYCTLEFDLSQGVDAGTEVIFNNGDELQVSISDERLALMGYTLRFYYYLLDKGDYTQSKSYGELQSFDVKLDEDTVVVPFSDNQVYLQKSFDLVLLKDIGYRLLLSASSSTVMPEDDVVLTADYTLGSVPVEDASVEFYDGETLIDTVDTDEDGLAVLTVSNLSSGSHNFSCVCNGVYSNTVSVYVISDKVMELNVTGSSFSTYSSTPFTFNGRVFVDWGDDSELVEYTGGKLTHTYNSGSHTVKLYGDITSLGSKCFDNCTSLTSIVIPNSVTSIGDYCFRNCIRLTSIEIPNSVTSLGAYCFYYCIGLTSIEIPNSVTSLGGDCFCYCSGLTSIEIPNSVTSIGTYCFEFCGGLTSIKLNWNTSTNILAYKSNWIYATPSNLLFHIPSGTTSLYTARYYPSNRLEERVVDSVSLTGDKSILSYADSDSATLSATVLDQYSSPMSGVTVEFFKGSTSLGTATTNSSGIATKTYASAGAGYLSFTASVGTISSETCELIDAIFYDEAVTGHKNENTYYNANCQETVSDTGTTVAYTGSGAYLQYRFGQTNTTDKPFSIGTKIEFDVVDITSMAIIFYGSSNYSRTLPTSSGKITITVDSDYITVYQDATQIAQVSTSSYITDKFSFGFTINNSSGSIKYKDIRIYSLNSINLVASQSILSYGDSTVLTATLKKRRNISRG